MAVWAVSRRVLGSLALLAALVLMGCDRFAAKPPPEVAAEPVEANPTPPEPAKPVVKIDPRLTQSFEDATRKDPPVDWPRLADMTATNKSVGKLYTDVVRLWKEIPFVNAEGKEIEYSAHLETSQGVIEIALRPEIAPNHVRNFIALARAGYYDGLVFERLVEDVSEVEGGGRLELIEGGGPLGVNDPNYDSIGYWLKPEFDANVPHDEGTVGAWRGIEVDTASCKFYIILNKPPESLNGNHTVFGKVTRGLDIARKIHQQPRTKEAMLPGVFKPEKAVVIQKVTIQRHDTDNSGQSGEKK